ncbi:MAG: hypothetical protein ACXWEI_22795, partial [Mycobacterium sp.]
MTVILRLLLGTEHRRRVNLTRMSIAAAVYLLCLLLQWQAVWSGFTSSSTAAWFTLFVVLGVCGFYAAVRSGVSLRFAEPALTMPQMIFATVSISLAYLINPHVRG